MCQFVYFGIFLRFYTVEYFSGFYFWIFIRFYNFDISYTLKYLSSSLPQSYTFLANLMWSLKILKGNSTKLCNISNFCECKSWIYSFIFSYPNNISAKFQLIKTRNWARETKFTIKILLKLICTHLWIEFWIFFSINLEVIKDCKDCEIIKI